MARSTPSPDPKQERSTAPAHTPAGEGAAERWQRVKTLFCEALDRPDAERRAFVEAACAGDLDLRRDVTSLLESDRSAGSFCETPAAALLGGQVLGGLSTARLQPGTQVGAYEISGLIGAGGMGEVYRARDTRLGREVAIKTVPADAANGNATARLLREARHASSLKHPNISTIYEVGESNGVPFIVMELLDGQSLSELQRGAKLPLDDTLRYAIQIADALDHAHSRGIVHRDLKSSNVVIERGGRAIVLDFGLAKRLPQNEQGSESVTQLGPAGTLTHMAPEVLLGGRGDPRSDVWSLGVLLYQLVNGHLPFSGRTPFETSSAILSEPTRSVDRSVPIALRLVIARCLVKNPEERYQRAAEVRAALQAILARRSWTVLGRLLMPNRRTGVRIVAAAAVAALIVAGALRTREWLAPTRAFRTVALLPLVTSVDQAPEDFYAAGMTDALIAQLGAAGDVRVISGTSAMQAAATGKRAPDIARELGAEAIIEGRLHRAAGVIRLDLRLVEAGTGKAVWSETFERGNRDILVLQADATRGLANAVRAGLRPGAAERLTTVRAIDPDVYEAYLKGRYEWNRRTASSLQDAIAHFRRALELDPTYAPAHAALADCYNQLGTVMVGTGSPREYRPRAAAEAVRALQIDANSSEAHAALGYVRHYQWQWAEAEKAFLRAIDLNPSNALARLWYANLLMSRARFDESLRQAHAARDLDPFSLIVNANIGWILYVARRHDEAVAHLTRTVALDPQYPQTRWRLAAALASTGRFDESLEQVNELLRLTKRSAPSLSMLAIVYARAGRPADARAVLRELLETARTEYVPPATIGSVYGALGDIDPALDWLERSYEEGSNATAYLATEPWYEPVRTHPRFQSLLRRTGQR
jgi:tetratricopeptide (TPR) repeat protein/TolB-like protein/predicted Ser/Thr protein kinase